MTWAVRRLTAFLAAGSGPYPHPVEACQVCPWETACRARREADDHLSRVAGIRPRQIRLLEAAGVRTVAALAALEAGAGVRGLGRETLGRLVLQARLLVEAGRRGRPLFRVLPPAAGRGLARLPDPRPGDLGAEVEEEAGADGLPRVTAVCWGPLAALRAAQTATGDERHLFLTLVDALEAGRRADPACRCYHFGPALPEALKRLMGRYPGREAVVDNWFRTGFLVDLARVTAEGVAVSIEARQASDLAALWGGSPGGDAPPGRLEALAGQRRWLETLKAGMPAGVPGPEARTVPDPPPAPDPESGSGEPPFDLLSALKGFHRREDKVYWWHYFESRTYAGDDWVEDPEAVGGLIYEGTDGQYEYYRFPPQETRMKPGDRALDGPSGSDLGRIAALDPVEGRLVLRPDFPGLHPEAILPGRPPPKEVLAEALADLAGEGEALAVRHPALWAVLTRARPRFRDLEPGAPLLAPGGSPQAGARRLALALDRSYLVVQGPPGTGKTFTGAALIVDLLQAGRRVGVMAHSHQVVAHLLEGVAAEAARQGLAVQALQKVSGSGQAAATPAVRPVTDNRKLEAALRGGRVSLVGGTAWLFARPALIGSLDVLVMDEAGQLSLADALAAGRAAESLVLLGDPRQLNQPIQGSHPPGAAVSVLEHLLGGRATVPPEQGVFLDESRRLHPALSAPLSGLIYEGRLRSHPACARRAVGGAGPWAGAGFRFVPVEHRGNRTVSPEEAEVVARLWHLLVGRPWQDPEGERVLGPADVLVVAPFNAQVNLLRARLPVGARVGTVDKFQGQEAPVVIYSLAASGLEELPRGMGFLFSLNRLNVAVSRAQALAVLVASPTLLASKPPDPAGLELMNAVAALILAARTVDAGRLDPGAGEGTGPERAPGRRASDV